MNPDEIKLNTVNKLFEYEKQARSIETLEFEELKNFCKLYCKLYLKQQEVLMSLPKL